jgi:peptide deformylase
LLYIIIEMKPIVIIPDKVLSEPAKTVIVFDKKLKYLIADMTETLIHTRNPKGVGLAAPQIGSPWRVFVIKPTAKSNVRAFVNPEIIKKNNEAIDPKKDDSNRMEGCLSIPAIWGKVKRYDKISLVFQDESGIRHVEEFSGFTATIIQHETDHINGILFTQRVVEQSGKLFQSGTDKEGKDVMEEIKL